MILVEFVRPTSEQLNLPFPSWIAENQRVLYHGTSDFMEAQIDEEGLRPWTQAFTRAEVEAVVAIFEELRWGGRTGGSRAALQHFSLSELTRGQPTYLAECAERAMLYATRDFAGGEIARGLRYSLDDLHAYVSDPSIRAAHLNYVSREIRDCEEHGCVPPALPNPDLGVLEQRLFAMGGLRSRANKAVDGFHHGVVYAVEIPASLHDSIRYSTARGVEIFGTVEPRLLVAKTHVPHGYQHDLLEWKDLPPAYQWLRDTVGLSP